MSALPKTVDCAPLETPVPVRLTDRHLRRIEPVRRTLLRPLDFDHVDDWRLAVNRGLKDAFRSDSSMFQLSMEGIPLCLSEEFDVELLDDYTRQIMPDLVVRASLFRQMLQLGAGNRSMAWRRHLSWFYDSDYWGEMVMPHRSFDPLWAAAPMEDRRYPAVIHTYHATLNGDRFGPADVQLMKLLQPALEAGVRTVLRTAEHRSSLTRSIDAQSDGAMVFDLTGRLLHRNPAVARIAPTRRVERALVDAGAAMARGLGASDLEAGAEPANAARSVDTRAGPRRLHAVRVGAGVFGLSPVALVTVSGGPGPVPDHDAIRERFGLTKRQAEVAVLLAERKSNAEIAELLCISPHTARHHTEAVMGALGLSDRRDVEEKLREASGQAR